MKKYDPLDLNRLQRYPLESRKSLVSTEQFAQVTEASSSLQDFFSSLPDVLAAKRLKEVAVSIATAVKNNKTVLFMSGAHLIKCGLTPLLLDFAERGIVTAVATHGATLIHDIEIALAAVTSEDVTSSIKNGSFGMSEDTAITFSRIVKEGRERGLGCAAGELLSNTPYGRLSLFAGLHRLGVTVTVHSAIGTDIVHMHPELDPAALGEATHTDFRKLCSVVGDLDGGVALNIGSAVIMPEVFIKALSVARNITGKPKDFTTVNMDFIKHYRPTRNVLERPGGVGIELIGHHEIMLPLLHSAVLLALEGRL